MKVEVVYASENNQTIIPLEVSENCTLYQAIIDSHILDICPEIDLQKQKTGIFNIISPLNTGLKENDRVEIYRPLLIDPMTRRFERVKKERKDQKAKQVSTSSVIATPSEARRKQSSIDGWIASPCKKTQGSQ